MFRNSRVSVKDNQPRQISNGFDQPNTKGQFTFIPKTVYVVKNMKFTLQSLETNLRSKYDKLLGAVNAGIPVIGASFKYKKFSSNYNKDDKAQNITFTFDGPGVLGIASSLVPEFPQMMPAQIPGQLIQPSPKLTVKKIPSYVKEIEKMLKQTKKTKKPLNVRTKISNSLLEPQMMNEKLIEYLKEIKKKPANATWACLVSQNGQNYICFSIDYVRNVAQDFNNSILQSDGGIWVTIYMSKPEDQEKPWNVDLINSFGAFPFSFSSEIISCVLQYDGVEDCWEKKELQELMKKRCLKINGVENPHHIFKDIEQLDDKIKLKIENFYEEDTSIDTTDIFEDDTKEATEIIQYYIAFIIEKNNKAAKDKELNNSVILNDQEWQPSKELELEIKNGIDNIKNQTGYRQEEYVYFMKQYQQVDQIKYINEKIQTAFSEIMLIDPLSKASETRDTGPQQSKNYKRKQKALKMLKNASDVQNGGKFTYSDFKLLTTFSSLYNEQGYPNQDDCSPFFEKPEYKEMSFQDLMRPQIFKLLKYMGKFENLTSSNFFVNEQEQEKFDFCHMASHKMPFQFIYQSHEQIKKDLMQKYLENPFNPASFVQYDQLSVDLGDPELDVMDSKIKRTIDISSIYNKLQKPIPNLLCIGTQATGKSSLLNSIFGVASYRLFEEIQTGALGLFHDSVDIMFDSQDFPSGFNIFDFQGFACADYLLIEGLIRKLPCVTLLIQVTDNDYFQNTIQKINEETRKRIAPNIFVIMRQDKDQAPHRAQSSLKALFGDQFDIEKQIFTFGTINMQQGSAFANQCTNSLQSIRKFVQEKRHKLMQEFEKKENIYQGQFGVNWYLEDGLTELTQKDKLWGSAGITLQIKEPRFREEHMKMKKIIAACTPEQKLRHVIFPFYINELEQIKVKKQLEDQTLLLQTKESKNLNSKYQDLLHQKEKIESHEIFKQWLELYNKGDIDMCDDIIAQVESDYVPRIKEERILVSDYKEQAQKIMGNMNPLEKLEGEIKPDCTEQQKMDYENWAKEKQNIHDEIKKLNVCIENKVLDSELFQREAKHYLNINQGVQRNLFNEKSSQNFEDGQPLEIIDGDTSNIFKDAIEDIFEWVQNQHKNNKKLLVITIMGPQSSGKSTLLNILFGAKFKVSAGRCTKGLNAMLLRTDYDEIKEILVLDSEGIFSIERNDPTYDRKLVIFCMAVSNLLLINIKGELNAEIEKVLQVAIYAINKIVQAKVGLKVPEVKFILRDQIASGTQDMEKAYSLLKSKMREAAKAAQANLDNVLKMPEQAKDIVYMFASALNKEIVNSNPDFQVILSQQVFRDQCSQFRESILKQSKNLDDKDKVENLQVWLREASDIWTAIMEAEDLTMIQDLKEINDSRIVMSTLKDYRKLQLMGLPNIDKDRTSLEQFDHPFLTTRKDEYPGDEHRVKVGETIFAKFSSEVQEILERTSEQSEKNEQQNFNRNDKMNTDRDAMIKMKEDIIMQEQAYGHMFTKEMGPNLQNQIRVAVQNIIESIWEKAMEKYKQKESENTLNGEAGKFLKELKEKVVLAKTQGKDLTKENFLQQIDEKIKITLTSIQQRFLKTPDEMFQESKRLFIEFKQFQEKNEKKENESNSEEFHFLKTKFIEKPSKIPDNLCFETILDKAKIENNVWEQEEIERDVSKLFEYRNENFYSQFDNLNKQDIRIKQLDEKKRNLQNQRQQKFFKGIFANYEKQLTQIDDDIKVINDINNNNYEQIAIKGLYKKGEMQIIELSSKMSEIIKKVDKVNESDDAKSYPESARNDLFDLFNKTFTRIIKESNSSEVCRFENDLPKYLSCNVREFESLFARTIFSQIFKQVKRNEDIINKKTLNLLEGKVSEAIDFYDNLSKQLQGAQSVSISFMELIAKTYGNLLKKTLIKKYEQWEHNELNIDKIIIQQCSMEEFKMEEGETKISRDIIMEHMKNPLGQEKRLVKGKYNQMCKRMETDLKEQFKTLVKSFRSNIQYFFGKLEKFVDKQHSHTFLDGLQILDQDKVVKKKSDENIKQSTEFLNYIYGEIFNQVSKDENSLEEQVKKKQDLEKYQMWIDQVPLPTVLPNKIFNEQILKQLKDQYTFKKDDLFQIKIQLVNPLQEISQFIAFLKFDYDSKEDTITNIFASIQEKFIKELEAELGCNKSYDSFENFALGCQVVCYFCGCRCNSIASCGDQKSHSSDFHRPMCFKGSFEADKDKKKHLLQDFCSSKTNVASRWRKTDNLQSGTNNILERLNEMNLHTADLNIILEWNTGSDLDIMVMCACNIWHGYGAENAYGAVEYNGSGGSCYCEKCGMRRDYDIRGGEDNQNAQYTSQETIPNPRAIEHVYFKEPQKLHNKEIGMRVFNFKNNTKLQYNPFKIALINKYGFQLWPKRGKTSIEHDPATMTVDNKSNEYSEEYKYTYQPLDDNIGQDLLTIGFPEHVINNKATVGLWTFGEANSIQLEQNNNFKQYIGVCQKQWKKVSKEMCDNYKAEQIPELNIPLG